MTKEQGSLCHSNRSHALHFCQHPSSAWKCCHLQKCHAYFNSLLANWLIHLSNFFCDEATHTHHNSQAPSSPLTIFLLPVLDPDILLLYVFLYQQDCSLFLLRLLLLLLLLSSSSLLWSSPSIILI